MNQLKKTEIITTTLFLILLWIIWSVGRVWLWPGFQSLVFIKIDLRDSWMTLLTESLFIFIVCSWVLWQSPIGKEAVPHWASMLRWIWPISEYNLKTRDSWKQTPRRVTCHDGNVEGAGLKNNSRSTTHIDLQVGTGGKLHALIYPHDLVTSGRAGKVGHLLTVCLTKVYQLVQPITSLCPKTCVIPTADRNRFII